VIKITLGLMSVRCGYGHPATHDVRCEPLELAATIPDGLLDELGAIYITKFYFEWETHVSSPIDLYLYESRILFAPERRRVSALLLSPAHDAAASQLAMRLSHDCALSFAVIIVVKVHYDPVLRPTQFMGPCSVRE
jgi:hypothetical protein